MSIVEANTAVSISAAQLRRAEELLDVLFTTPKELRHQAERILGELFVPTEVVHAAADSAHLVLRSGSEGEIHILAKRERHWHPFRITRVDHVTR
jgi:hypothetical protein